MSGGTIRPALTAEDVELVRQCQSDAWSRAHPNVATLQIDVAAYCETCGRGVLYPAIYCREHLPDALDALAAKLAALLPPEGT